VQRKKLDRPLEAPYYEAPYWGGAGRPHLPLFKISNYKYRPLGTSIYHTAPWAGEYQDDSSYIPTILEEQTLLKGMEKAYDPKYQLNEEIIQKAQSYLEKKFKSIWTKNPENYFIGYEEALTKLDLKKSPGDPYFLWHPTKGRALQLDPEMVRQNTSAMFSLEPPVCRFNLTLKSELRQKEKVEAGKTRVFMAGPLHHLIACNQLFCVQNDQIMDRMGQHPITIGIQLPGHEFVRAVTRLGLSKGQMLPLNDADVSGCDLRFNLRAARVIRDLRAKHLPPRFKPYINYIYDTVYCGVGICLGNVYRVFGNKSGWLNTGHDNSIFTWLMLVYSSLILYPDTDPDHVFKLLVNGDDVLMCVLKGELQLLTDCLRVQGFFLETDDFTPRNVYSVQYLSHSLRKRYVHHFGEFVLAAGNREKMLCSINWIKRTEGLTFEESCVAHLVGLRICLFPWQSDFEEIDTLLGKYLDKVVITPIMTACLQARLSEKQCALIHTKVEGLFFPCPPYVADVIVDILGA